MLRYRTQKAKLMAFKREVLRRCGGDCEVPGCQNFAETVHHMLKASTHPCLKFDPDNGLGVCGPCHTEIERLLRTCPDKVPPQYPFERWLRLKDKADG